MAGWPGSLRASVRAISVVQLDSPAQATCTQGQTCGQVGELRQCPACAPLPHMAVALTYNTLVPAGQRPPAWAAVGVEARATYIRPWGEYGMSGDSLFIWMSPGPCPLPSRRTAKPSPHPRGLSSSLVPRTPARCLGCHAYAHVQDLQAPRPRPSGPSHPPRTTGQSRPAGAELEVPRP